jgi:sugar lactone lactonase YvrE
MQVTTRVRVFMAALVLAIVAGGGIANASIPIQTVVSFDPSAGQFPESLTVDKTDDVFVSLINPVADILELRPNGDSSVVAHFDVGGFGPLGVKVDPSGTLYVAVSSFDPATRGVYRVRPDGTSTRLPGTDGMAFPNDLALDKQGNIYATDSIAGAVWRIPRGGSAEIWFQSPLLEGTGSLGLGFPLGANGIAIRNGQMIVANTEGGRIVRIPILHDGSAGVGATIADGSSLVGVDGIALSVHGNIYAAVNSQNTLVRLSSAGSIDTLATAADGLDNPSSLAFGSGKGDRQSLFVDNFSVFSASPHPGVLKAAVGEPGQPIP